MLRRTFLFGFFINNNNNNNNNDNNNNNNNKMFIWMESRTQPRYEAPAGLWLENKTPNKRKYYNYIDVIHISKLKYHVLHIMKEQSIFLRVFILHVSSSCA